MNRFVVTIFSLFFCALEAKQTGFSVKSGHADPPRYEEGEWVIGSGASACIEWDEFTVDSNETIRFQQLNSHSYVLNQVGGDSASSILGRLYSNGAVYLINSKGVFIGPDAYIETAGFIASTLDLLDEELSKKTLFFQNNNTSCESSIANQGTIHCSVGDVFLVGNRVENNGTISTLNGRQGLISGTLVLIRPEQAPELLIRTNDDWDRESLAENPYGLAICQKGKMESQEAYLIAQEDRCELSGSIYAQKGDKGGYVCLMAPEILLLDQAQINACGSQGGGEVLIGGDYQGNNPAIRHAKHVWSGPDSKVSADALEKGDGGKVIFWSDGETYQFGAVSAKGGAKGGDGGLIEMSGQYLEVGANATTEAPFGHVGTLLLDPINITITTSATSSNVTYVAPNFRGTSCAPTPSNIQNTLIQSFLNTNNVVVNTSATGWTGCTNAGTITVSAPITWSSARTLTLQADSTLTLNAAAVLTSTNATATFTAMDFSGNRAGTATQTGAGVNVNGATLSSQGGKILISGQGSTSNSNAILGITGSAFFISNQNNGEITLTGTGGQATGTGGACLGISFSGGTISAVNGTVSLIGQGGIGANGNQTAILLSGSVSISTTSGNIVVNGSAGLGGSGLILNRTSSSTPGISTVNGVITINGTGGGLSNTASNGCRGIFLANNSGGTAPNLSVTGSGSIYLNGQGGTGGTGGAGGIVISSGGKISLSGSASMTCIGIGGTSPSTNHGIDISGVIFSEGSGPVNLTGVAGSGTNYGINLSSTNGIQASATSSATFTLTGCAGGSSSPCSSSIASGTGPLYGINYTGANGINVDLNSTARVSLIGIGGPGSGGFNYGINIAATMTSPRFVQMLGTGGSAGTNNHGVFIGVNLASPSSPFQIQTNSSNLSIGPSVTSLQLSSLQVDSSVPTLFQNTQAVTIDTSGTAGGSIVFGGTVDGVSANSQTLSLLCSSTGSIQFNGNMGDTNSLASLTIHSSTGSTQFGSAINRVKSNQILIQGTGGVLLNNMATLTFDTTVASAGSVTFESPIDGSGSGVQNLDFILGSGSLSFSAPIGLTHSIGAFQVESAASVVFNGSISSSSDLSITSTNVTVNQPVLAAQNVTLNNSGQVTFSSTGYLSIDGTFLQTGTALVKTAGDIFTTNGTIQFNRPIELQGSIQLTTLGDTGNVVFGSSIDGNYDLILYGSSITFGGVVGTSPLNSIQVSSPGSIQMAGNQTVSSGPMSYSGNVVLAANCAFTNDGSLGTSFQGITGPFNLTLAASRSTVTVYSDIDLSGSGSTDGGTLIASAASGLDFQAKITTKGGDNIGSVAGYGGAVTLSSSNGSVSFHNINTSGGAGTPGGNAGTIIIQPSSTYSGGFPSGLIVINEDLSSGLEGNLVALPADGASGGNIILSANRSSAATVATIVSGSSNGIAIQGTNLNLGPFEAMTAFGDLSINCSGSLNLGDLVALNNLSLDSSLITYSDQGEQLLLNSQGGFSISPSTHFIAGSTYSQTGTLVESSPLNAGSVQLSESAFRPLLTFDGHVLNYDSAAFVPSVFSLPKPIKQFALYQLLIADAQLSDLLPIFGSEEYLNE